MFDFVDLFNSIQMNGWMDGLFIMAEKLWA